MRGALEDIASCSQLDDPAEIHHSHPVAEMADHREVVTDEQKCQTQLGLEIVEEIGSSAIMNLGSAARARAMPTLWRCPPLAPVPLAAIQSRNRRGSLGVISATVLPAQKNSSPTANDRRWVSALGKVEA